MIRFIINRKFDIGICTFSTSINSLRPYIYDVYNVDDKIVEFENKIFKLLVLFEFAQNFNFNIKSQTNSLIEAIEKHYHLNGDKYIQYNNLMEHEDDYIIAKDIYFEEANMIIEINKQIDDYKKSKEINENERIYIKIKDVKIQKRVEKFRLDINLPISKTKITADIILNENIEYSI